MPNGNEDWHVKLLEAEEEAEGAFRPTGFRLKEATDTQREAIRRLATQAGFKDLRGFWKWTQAADLTYYDLIKVASP